MHYIWGRIRTWIACHTNYVDCVKICLLSLFRTYNIRSFQSHCICILDKWFGFRRCVLELHRGNLPNNSIFLMTVKVYTLYMIHVSFACNHKYRIITVNWVKLCVNIHLNNVNQICSGIDKNCWAYFNQFWY